MDFQLVFHFAAATLPLLICFVCAVRDTVNKAPSQATLAPFANRWAGYGASWILVLLLIYCGAQAALTLGDCRGGFKDCCSCALIPDAAGRYASFLTFFGFLYILAVVFPALALFAGIEIAYRWRRRKAGLG
ncbi:hypothetical protein RA19_22390 [Leisingera sp. ANG-M1]|uniref:hypothetical protein n=1 Tax=Leisingera sp. ANG-M1 TaxID=1577895 RepID=UPI00058007B0|nr:hypothetical protein [Leisingera sp. ANG-M1]KIC07871.1 hypothetical protein RA19_22390 [Leisingera sp. ANG-M1]